MHLMVYPEGKKVIELPSQCHRIRKKMSHFNPVGNISKSGHGQS